MKLADRMLVGADGQVIVDGQMTIAAVKIFEVPGPPKLAWAYSGPQSVGHLFRSWINAATITTWEQLRDEGSDELARLNGKAQTNATTSGTKTEPATVVIVGYLGGESQILFLDEEGAGTLVDGKVHFAGGGGPHAWLVWDMAERVLVVSDLYSRPTLDSLLDCLVDRVPFLGGPSQVVEVLP